jgi:hypothetical protein
MWTFSSAAANEAAILLLTRSAGFVIYFLVRTIIPLLLRRIFLTSNCTILVKIAIAGIRFFTCDYRYNLAIKERYASEGPPPFIQVFLLTITLK